MKTVRDACQLQDNALSIKLSDQIEQLDELIADEEDGSAFFERTYITQGMQDLISEGIARLAGASSQAVFHLKQAMGGGKTHLLVGFGLLAKHPGLRVKYAAGVSRSDAFDSAAIAAFNGRNNPDHFLWGEIAQQLGKGEQFRSFWTSGPKAPDEKDWLKLFEGDRPVLILLDEMPPYFHYLDTQKVGNGTVADIATRAFANLLTAAGKKKNVCVVVSVELPPYGGVLSAYDGEFRLGGVFVVHGRLVVEGRVTAMRVVPALDVVEDLPSCDGVGGETGAVDQLALQGGEKALTHGVVVAVPGRAHRRTDPGVPATGAEIEGGVLRPSVGVMNDLRRSTLPQRHVQGLHDQRGVQVSSHRPADDTAAPGVEDHGKIEKPHPGGYVRDIGHPQLVGALCGEVALHQVGSGLGLPVLARGARALAPADASQVRGTHQALNALMVDGVATLIELDGHAGHPVGPTRPGVDLADPLDQGRIAQGPWRELTLTPRVVATGGNTQDTAHSGDGIPGLVIAHESEDLDGFESASRANQVAAFDKISRSMRNCLLSRRRRCSSWRSSVLRPPSPPPASRSACSTQWRIDSDDGSNSLANSSGVRPARTNSTICRRKAAGYGLCVLGMRHPPFTQVSGCPPNRGNSRASISPATPKVFFGPR